MGVEDRAPAVLPEEEAEKLRIGIESAVMRAVEAGWNAEQVRTEVEYVLETADDD